MAEFDKLKSLFLQSPIFQPTIKGWNRLEGRPRNRDFERSLRAEVRDPLWMLTRQWQFGEFQGEDAGSPVDARMLTYQTYLNRYAVGNQSAQKFEMDIPLEARVEREFWPDDLGRQVRIGRYFEKLLRINALPYKDNYLAQYAIDTSAPNPVYDKDTDQTRGAVAGKVINGVLLLKAIADGSHATWVDALPQIADSDRTKLKTTASELVQWAGAFATQPTSQADNAWSGTHLEYQFACAAEDADGTQTVLRADQYDSGHLDWYSFDVDATGKLEGAVSEPEKPLEECLSFIPTPVSFNGMPQPRFWQMENERIEFSNIDANTTDLIKLIMTEFMLLYGNDWCVFPYERKTGSLCEIRGLVITDVFGQRTFVKPAGSGIDDDWTRWSFFSLSTNAQTANTASFLPPALGKTLESQPLEKVNFIRDEMSNMVWGIESIVPSSLGRGVNGYESALAAENATRPPEPELQPTEAKIRYMLGTSVPYNWIPFLPAQLPGSNRDIRLQRARMPDLAASFKGRILDEPAPYFVHEEEVPQTGKSVTRTYQLTRTTDGKPVLWIGRKALLGKGEGRSWLAFDQIVDVV
ncbi:hypothetical protein [Larkinella rosea]|uniref:Uncharacterized protein n=1 Tax=Larkinella rosea TaxID=2025312 RepID=A0A3P1C340_9BACT|nr:hypothetical protein [Larkinella rosea]RRB07234.1 hypothetical protein EHT25_05500 [Larkinella rosea]